VPVYDFGKHAQEKSLINGALNNRSFSTNTEQGGGGPASGGQSSGGTTGGAGHDTHGGKDK